MNRQHVVSSEVANCRMDSRRIVNRYRSGNQHLLICFHLTGNIRRPLPCVNKRVQNMLSMVVWDIGFCKLLKRLPEASRK